MMRRNNEGFTAVELLVTLFVAATFLIAGYQLFNVVITDGGDTRAESRAGNIAYDYVRRYSDTATNPCTVQTPVADSLITVDSLSDVRVSVYITCPQPDVVTLSKVEAVLTYNSPRQSVQHATYVDKSKGATTGSTVTNGLVAWWTFNSNAKSSVGEAHGSVFGGASLTTGQNGRQDGAYNFNGTGYINAQIGSLSGDAPHSISLWVRPTTLAATGKDPFFMGSPANNSSSSLEFYTGSSAWYNWYNDIVTPPVATNSWTFVTLTYAGGGANTTNKKVYFNGSPVALTPSQANYGQIVTLPANPTVGIGYDRARQTAFFMGDIDDVRIYNRALTPSEATQLYSEGAQ